jgi:hypothetical protein
MIQVIDDRIYFVKGDKDTLPVNVTFNDDKPYEMGENEYLELTVRTIPDTSQPVLIYARSNPGDNKIIFTSEMTAEVDPGKYSVDIQFNDGTGEPRRVWPSNTAPYVKPDKTVNWKNFLLTP